MFAALAPSLRPVQDDVRDDIANRKNRHSGDNDRWDPEQPGSVPRPRCQAKHKAHCAHEKCQPEDDRTGRDQKDAAGKPIVGQKQTQREWSEGEHAENDSGDAEQSGIFRRRLDSFTSSPSERWARNLRADSPTIVNHARRVRLTRLFGALAPPLERHEAGRDAQAPLPKQQRIGHVV